jgi:3-hydroxyacyl-CoA dehydrogenase/enoyl-CoA hydratase/3-hydroxybutyryl-CoA epimerase/3-hydroxyacyl-CoA dehydrogenase/enoyl-CoA hydratase/3-hydroxybutyryl-CoA epimerase/enoyl-CoA isomerase
VEIGNLLRDEFVGIPDVASGLRHFDDLLAASQRDLGLQKITAEPLVVRRVGIVGAGMMGAAIAADALRHGLSVTMYDADRSAMASARQRLLDLLRGDMAEAEATQSAAQQFTLAERPVFPDCEVVLESIVETFTVKQQLYRQLEPDLGSSSVLASNTSTIPIARLAAGLADPGRFCGIHFFHPVRRRPLVEIIRGPATTAATVAQAAALAKRLGKLPIVVSDGPGFLVNRLLMPYLNEALDLLVEGVAIEQVEDAAVRFGMAMGPLRLLDEIGLDTALRAGMVLYSAFGERIAASPLLVSMVKRGRLGRKTGVGFFRYPTTDPQQVEPDPLALDLIRQWLRQKTLPPRQTITDRLFLPMLLEATRVLEEDRVAHPRDIDLAVILGLGFPAARGGLLYWADRLGVRQILNRLRALESLGPRTEPTALLLRMLRTGGRFYRWPTRGPLPALLRRPSAPAALGAWRKRA